GSLHIVTSVPSLPQQRRGYAKKSFWDSVLAAADDRIDQAFMFVGDFNTGLHRIDERGKTFFCAEHFRRLSINGWVDAWRHVHGECFEPTWFSVLPGGAKETRFGSITRLSRRFCCPGCEIADISTASGRRTSPTT